MRPCAKSMCSPSSPHSSEIRRPASASMGDDRFARNVVAVAPAVARRRPELATAHFADEGVADCILARERQVGACLSPGSLSRRPSRGRGGRAQPGRQPRAEPRPAPARGSCATAWALARGLSGAAASLRSTTRLRTASLEDRADGADDLVDRAVGEPATAALVGAPGPRIDVVLHERCPDLARLADFIAFAQQARRPCCRCRRW